MNTLASASIPPPIATSQAYRAFGWVTLSASTVSAAAKKIRQEIKINMEAIIVTVLLLSHFALFAFGTIINMNFQQRRPNLPRRVFLSSIIFLLTACASVSDLPPDSVSPAFSTPTPFQPQAESAGTTNETLSLPSTEPTYTPFPQQNTARESLPTPVMVAPSSAGTDFSLLNINNPLTGLPVNDPALLNRRPMVIKVANAPDAIRPQSGLTLADVVYEYYIEWGDTRFIAVMYGNDSTMVGPVRSGRYFD